MGGHRLRIPCLQGLISGDPAASPIGVLSADPTRFSWAIALTLGVAVVFAIGRFQVPAFTILLSVVPCTAGAEAFNITVGAGYPPATYLPILIPVTVGLVLLVIASRCGLRAGSSVGSAASLSTAAKRSRRRSGVAVAILAPLLALGGTATALTASGLSWTRPLAVNWTGYWQSSTSRTWTDWALHPDASLSFRLPSGGSCTVQARVLDGSADPRALLAARNARAYLAAESATRDLLRDANIDEVIQQNRAQQNTAQNFWGVSVRYGYGTDNDNRDVDYFEAVQTLLRQSIYDRVENAGASDRDISFESMQRCTGQQV